MTLYTQKSGIVYNAKGPVLTPATWTGPLKASGNSRYLVDSTGLPVPILTRNCWAVIGLTPTDYGTYLDDTRNKGFTCIEVTIPARYPGSVNSPYSGNGNLPFLKNLAGGDWNGGFSGQTPDFSTVNPAYLNDVADFFAACESRGIAVQAFFTYGGFPNTDEGWIDEMVSNGATKIGQYAVAVATKFIATKNLIWMYGGDQGTGTEPYSAPELAVVQAYINGIRSVATACKLASAEWRRGSITTDQTTFGQYITFNGCYAGATDINNQGARAYAYTPTLPAFGQEWPFETQDDPVRRFYWWGFLATCGGTMLGYCPNLCDFPSGWQNSLSSRGQLDASYANDFFCRLEWQNLIPSNGMISSGGGTANSATQVAVSRDGIGSTAVAYLPPAHTGTLTLTMTSMRGPTTSQWFDPTANRYIPDATGIANSGTHVFTKPGNNAVGNADWALLLTA